ENITAAARALAREKEMSVFMLFRAALALVFYKYSSQDDMIIGTVDAGRDHADLENQLGFFINSIPLRTKVEGTQTVTGFLERIKADTLDCFRHKQYPYDLLVQDMGMPAGHGINPLFDVVLSVQNLDPVKHPGAAGIEITRFERETRKAPFGLIFTVCELDTEFYIEVYYKKDLYRKDTAVMLQNGLRTMLERMAAMRGATVDQLVSDESQAIGKKDFLDNLFNLAFE
ncbi:MAG TPA: condensation domain-containing protein, partial [Chitinophagaceae bacterium]|nr:condensation domain-containing protein [Chitinophagaceae bacterium]